ncbi:unnamed protein product [Ectocarpus sp. 13 AM-2016]
MDNSPIRKREVTCMLRGYDLRPSHFVLCFFRDRYPPQQHGSPEHMHAVLNALGATLRETRGRRETDPNHTPVTFFSASTRSSCT